MQVKVISAPNIVEFSGFDEMNVRVTLKVLEGNLVALDSSRGHFVFTRGEFQEFLKQGQEFLNG